MHRPFDVFANSKQISSVKEYLEKFEQLSGLLEMFPHAHILDKFLGGLKEEIKYKVLATRPRFLKEAISLAKTYEDKYFNQKKSFKPYLPKPMPDFQNQNTPPNMLPNTSNHYRKLSPMDLNKKGTNVNVTPVKKDGIQDTNAK